MEFQGLMENNLSFRQVIDSFVAGNTETAIDYIDTFPEIMSFSRKVIAFLEMCLEERIKFINMNLIRNMISIPYHDNTPN